MADDDDAKADVVEIVGYDVARERRTRRDGDAPYVFGADHTNGVRADDDDDDDEARYVQALATTNGGKAIVGVREDELIDATFGVMIPGSTRAGEVEESLTRAARRFAAMAQERAWRTRLQTPVAEPSGESADESADDGRDRRVVYADDADPAAFDVHTYEEVTSKYINLSYYEKRVAPQTRFPDGSVNATPIRVANWIFAEEFVKRDGFVEEPDTEEESTAATEEEEETTEASPPPEAPEAALEEPPTGCFACFGGGRDKKTVSASSESESVEEETQLQAVFDYESERKTLVDLEVKLATLELNCGQLFLDMKRLVHSVRGNFTVEMLKTDPRALELQNRIREIEITLKRMLFTRDGVKMDIKKRRRRVAEFEKERALEAKRLAKEERVDAEAALAAEIGNIPDPLEDIDRLFGSAPAALFLMLGPLYLWHYYEWIQTNRVMKRRLESKTSTTTVYFYNPLLVAGARRLRLPASNVELLAMLLAVQSLLSFQLWIIDQPDYSQEENIAKYEYIVLHTFVRVAVPCYNATACALRRQKRRSREQTSKKLWKYEKTASKPSLRDQTVTTGNLSSFASADVVAGDGDGDGDDSGSELSSLLPSELAEKDLVQISCIADMSAFREALKDLDPAERQKVRRMRVKQEVLGSEGRFGTSVENNLEEMQVKTDPSEPATSVSVRTSERFSEFLQSSSVDASVLEPGDENYEKIRREYILKARAQRKAEDEARDPSKKSAIFDVGDILNKLLVDESRLETVPGPIENEEEVKKSRLDVDQADTVLQAVARLNQNHKKKYRQGTGYLPNNATYRDVDQTKVARAVAENDDDEI